MITSTTKILYLHGLDSTLQDDRRAVLAPYGEIVAPVLDYRNTPDLFSTLVRDYADVTAIIGSSAGGLVAYYLAQALLKPCLLFYGTVQSLLRRLYSDSYRIARHRNRPWAVVSRTKRTA